MPNKVASVVLSHSAPCDVPQGYASVAEFPAALLDGPFEHPFPAGRLRACGLSWTTLLGICFGVGGMSPGWTDGIRGSQKLLHCGLAEWLV